MNKEQQMIDLIKFHYTNDIESFKNLAIKIANDFYSSGEYKINRYLLSLVDNTDTVSIQSLEHKNKFLKKINLKPANLYLPDYIYDELNGIANAINRNLDVNKFLFFGNPGTGKTESVKIISNLLKRDLYIVNLANIIDSHLGQTSKNIESLFEEIKTFDYHDRFIILFDEIDALVLNRYDANDLREMSRAIATFLKCLDELDEDIIMFATTNMHLNLDKALIRRFDASIDFDKCNNEDYKTIALKIFNDLLAKYKIDENVQKIGSKIFQKIIEISNTKISPAELKNIIKSSIVLTDINDKYGFLSKIYKKILFNNEINLDDLKEQKFSLKEIEILTGISKTTASRKLKA